MGREKDGDRGRREKERERRHLNFRRLRYNSPVPRPTNDCLRASRLATPRNQPKCQKRATAHAPARPAPSSYAQPNAIPIGAADPIRLDPRESFTAKSIETGTVPQASSILDARRRVLFRRCEKTRARRNVTRNEIVGLYRSRSLIISFFD